MVKIFQKIIGIKGDQNDDFIEEENDVDALYSEEVEDQDSEEDVQDEWNAEDYEEGQLSIDVFQTLNNIIVKSTIAGVKTGDIDISINNDMLTIRGQRSMSEEIKEEDYYKIETSFGKFSRTFTLPDDAHVENIEATSDNGVLEVVIPKLKKEENVRSIEVK